MPREPLSTNSLRRQLLVRALATFIVCAVVVLLFLPLISGTLRNYNATTSDYIEGEKAANGTNIARLIVLQLSGLKNLLQVSPGLVSAAEQPIIDMLWETVTFNANIQRIELIQGQKEAAGKHLTFLYYRAPPGEKPPQGPQKIVKEFSGPEEELIAGIDQWRKVDQTLLGDINYGPKKEGEMLLRYYPVHVMVPGKGPVYWGVAKIGISTGWASRTLANARQRQVEVQTAVRRQIILSLVSAAVLFLIMVYPWVGRLTTPLDHLVAAATDVNKAQPREYPVWLENLRQVDPRRLPEVRALQQVLLRLGNSIPKLGQRLVAGERLACLGKVMSRNLPVLQGLSARLQALEGQESDQGRLPPQVHEEAGELLAELQSKVQDIECIWPAETPAWQRVDLTPGLQSAWRLVTAPLPGDIRLSLDIQPLPLVWGSPVELPLAVVYLLDALADRLDAGSQLQLTAAATPARGVQIVIEAAGAGMSETAWQEALSVWQGQEEVREQLGPALAGAIVSQHGGSLTINAREKGRVICSLALPPLAKANDSQKPVS